MTKFSDADNEDFKKLSRTLEFMLQKSENKVETNWALEPRTKQGNRLRYYVAGHKLNITLLWSSNLLVSNTKCQLVSVILFLSRNHHRHMAQPRPRLLFIGGSITLCKEASPRRSWRIYPFIAFLMGTFMAYPLSSAWSAWPQPSTKWKSWAGAGRESESLQRAIILHLLQLSHSSFVNSHLLRTLHSSKFSSPTHCSSGLQIFW